MTTIAVETAKSMGLSQVDERVVGARAIRNQFLGSLIVGGVSAFFKPVSNAILRNQIRDSFAAMDASMLDDLGIQPGSVRDILEIAVPHLGVKGWLRGMRDAVNQAVAVLDSDAAFGRLSARQLQDIGIDTPFSTKTIRDDHRVAGGLMDPMVSNRVANDHFTHAA